MTTLSKTRRIVKYCTVALALGCVGNTYVHAEEPQGEVPAYLKGYEDLYRKDPRSAALEWFKNAKFGLFFHYGLYSLEGIHPFEQWKNKIPVKKYEKKMDRFTAEKFDADAICDLAVEAGMKYVTMVTKHCEGFCLWSTAETDFNSFNSAAYRDLVEEMVDACRKRNLGLFFFYEHGFDWRHPHAARLSSFPNGPNLVEVDYPTPEPTYAHGEEYDFNKYVEYVDAQITELLSNYGPVAGIWLDGAAVPSRSGEDKAKFKLQELYDHIHELQPQALVSYKWGMTGTEDFLAPEIGQFGKISAEEAASKPVEICESMSGGWGYVKGQSHRDADWVMKRLEFAEKHNANFLLNIAPLPDGSLDPRDVKTLKEVGRRLRAQAEDQQESKE